MFITGLFDQGLTFASKSSQQAFHLKTFQRRHSRGMSSVHRPKGSSHCHDNVEQNSTVSSALNQDKPFCCTVCGKGFLSSTGFNLHMQAHEGRRFMCPVCDSRFNQKVHLKTHLKGVHKLVQCLTCSMLFGLGAEYNQHVLHCHLSS